MEIKEDFCSFELSKLLKDKGFNGKVEHFYDSAGNFLHFDSWMNLLPKEKFIEAPTLQMAMKWLREEYYVYIEINKNPDSSGWRYSIFNQAIIDGDEENGFTTSQVPKNISYEQACEDAIKACVNFLI